MMKCGRSGALWIFSGYTITGKVTVYEGIADNVVVMNLRVDRLQTGHRVKLSFNPRNSDDLSDAKISWLVSLLIQLES